MFDDNKATELDEIASLQNKLEEAITSDLEKELAITSAIISTLLNSPYTYSIVSKSGDEKSSTTLTRNDMVERIKNCLQASRIYLSESCSYSDYTNIKNKLSILNNLSIESFLPENIEKIKKYLDELLNYLKEMIGFFDEKLTDVTNLTADLCRACSESYSFEKIKELQQQLVFIKNKIYSEKTAKFEFQYLRLILEESEINPFALIKRYIIQTIEQKFASFGICENEIFKTYFDKIKEHVDNIFQINSQLNQQLQALPKHIATMKKKLIQLERSSKASDFFADIKNRCKRFFSDSSNKEQNLKSLTPRKSAST